MKKIFLSLVLVMAVSVAGFSQINKMIGKWKTIDDKDGSVKSIVFVFKANNGKYYGKIEKLFNDPEKRCTECDGANQNKPIVGLMIINNMEEADGVLTGGTILDPKNGKVYNCNISLENDTDKLKVRGSLDKGGFIGRTQLWIRAK